MPEQGRVGDTASCQGDSHGCPSCPHNAKGPAVQGSTDVLVNQLPALRVNDRGLHVACCGPNTWQAVKGSTSVFINGQPAMRKGDTTVHCGSSGTLSDGSPDVIVGG